MMFISRHLPRKKRQLRVKLMMTDKHGDTNQASLSYKLYLPRFPCSRRPTPLVKRAAMGFVGWEARQENLVNREFGPLVVLLNERGCYFRHNSCQ